jgi:intein-encoded DNA endonuclease-like protein
LQQEIGDVAAATQRKFCKKFANKEDWSTKNKHVFISIKVEEATSNCLTKAHQALFGAN